MNNHLNWFQSLVMAACGVLLWTITAQINHYIAPWHLNVFTGGLLIAFPALIFAHRDLWRIVLVLGLWCDAAAPVPFGLHTVLFLAACAIIWKIRGRLARADTVLRVITAIIANSALYVAITLVLAFRTPALHGVMLWTLLVNLVFSNVLVLVIAPWYFALQERTLQLAGATRILAASVQNTK